MMNREELIAFEDKVAALFNDAQIRAPVHLYSGNEAEMIEVFKTTRPPTSSPGHRRWGSADCRRPREGAQAQRGPRHGQLLHGRDDRRDWHRP